MTKHYSGTLLAISACACLFSVACVPFGYESSYVSPRAKATPYPTVAIQNDGYLPDIFIVELQQALQGTSVTAGKGDLYLRISGQPIPFATDAKPGYVVFIQNILVDAVRASDGEIVFSMVKNYPLTVNTDKNGNITSMSGGLMRGVAQEIARRLASQVLNREATNPPPNDAPAPKAAPPSKS